MSLSLCQRVICPQCRLGVTRVVDLSQQDMKKVRQLALIDMTALCDLLELEVKRHKTCKRKMAGESHVFTSSCVFMSPAINNDTRSFSSIRELFVRRPSRLTGGERSEDQTQHSDPSVPPDGKLLDFM